MTVRGSRITAGDTARLIANGNLTLEAAANTQTQQSTNRASSASIGVVIDSRQQGFGVQVAGSRARGRADGTSQTWTETTVQAGSRAQLASGKDTTLTGAIVTAPHVTATTGGDLTITSLQDTDTYTSRQQQVGGSVILGPASSGNVNLSGSRIDSTYASVNEVSGIRAGDDGFNVTVQGNATLTGSIIASSEAAVDAQRNRLQVGGATTTYDIANGARYAASGYGVNLGTAVSPQGGWVPAGTGVGLGQDGDAIDSVTRAGISGMAGDTTARSHDAPAPLAKIFDAARVQSNINAQVQITQEFSARAPRAVAAYADGQVKAIDAQLGHESDDTRRAQLLAEKQQWVEGGAYRVLMHTATGALGSNVAGAAGAAVAATAAPALNDWQQAMAKALTEAGMNETLAQGVAGQVSGLAAAGLGAMAGGATGAGTALAIDANNRQLHQEEKTLAKDLAEKSKGKYAQAQIEDQMRLMGNSRYRESANKAEIFVDTSDPATARRLQETFKQDSNLPIAAQGRAVVELLDNPNSEIQNFIIANTSDYIGWIPGQSPYVASKTKGAMSNSRTPLPHPTAKCGNADANCKAGMPQPLPEREMVDRLRSVAEAADAIGTQAGRIGAAAIAASAVPGPHDPVAAAVAVTASVVQIGAAAVQHALQPNPGLLGVDTFGTAISEASNAVPTFGKLVAPVVNEVNETVKKSSVGQAAQDWINERLKK